MHILISAPNLIIYLFGLSTVSFIRSLTFDHLVMDWISDFDHLTVKTTIRFEVFI